MGFRIEICGGIASGKTTFASLFEGVATVIYEDFHAVPFWQDFCAAPTKHAFETELSFLLQHYHQVKRALTEKVNIVVCDFSFWLDAAYAHVSLRGGNLAAFRTVLEQVRMELGTPELLISLNCPSEVELNRIQARGRHSESQINLDFLERLNRAFRDETLAENSAPILEVDSGKEDFAHNISVRGALSRRVASEISRLRTNATILLEGTIR